MECDGDPGTPGERIVGLCPRQSPQDAVEATRPGVRAIGGVLQRQSMKRSQREGERGECELVAKPLSLVSLKGEDIMIQAPSAETQYHRSRVSLPAALWSSRTVMGWRWRIRSKFIHMVDSLVCLHSLSRGRSSSRKLRHAISHVNALLLASGCHGGMGLRPYLAKEIRSFWPAGPLLSSLQLEEGGATSMGRWIAYSCWAGGSPPRRLEFM